MPVDREVVVTAEGTLDSFRSVLSLALIATLLWKMLNWLTRRTAKMAAGRGTDTIEEVGSAKQYKL